MEGQAHGRTDAEAHGMRVNLVSPEQALFDGDATAVVAPAYDGKVGILPRHAPFLTLLGSGELVIRSAAGSRRFGVEGGFLLVLRNRVRVVAEKAEAR
jgi:F-type H+-transporting ATPase subunit epsilon